MRKSGFKTLSGALLSLGLAVTVCVQASGNERITTDEIKSLLRVAGQKEIILEPVINFC